MEGRRQGRIRQHPHCRLAAPGRIPVQDARAGDKLQRLLRIRTAKHNRRPELQVQTRRPVSVRHDILQIRERQDGHGPGLSSAIVLHPRTGTARTLRLTGTGTEKERKPRNRLGLDFRNIAFLQTQCHVRPGHIPERRYRRPDTRGRQRRNRLGIPRTQHKNRTGQFCNGKRLHHPLRRCGPVPHILLQDRQMDFRSRPENRL